MAKWRQSERAQMIEAIRDMIQEARRMATSKRAPASERIRWTRLAGQLIWHKPRVNGKGTHENEGRGLRKTPKACSTTRVRTSTTMISDSTESSRLGTPAA